MKSFKLKLTLFLFSSYVFFIPNFFIRILWEDIHLDMF